MKTIGNLIWFIFGGWMIALEYILGGVTLMITIIGIPFGIQSVKLGVFSIWPFGHKIEKAEDTVGCLNIAMNIIWFFVAGFWIMLTHLLWGIFFCITIIGIPFGKQHFKLMKLALSPFGKRIV